MKILLKIVIIIQLEKCGLGNKQNFEDFSDYIEEKFGKIKGRYVLYTGENDRIDSPFGEINFFSAELFLKSVVKAKTVENLLALLDKSQG